MSRISIYDYHRIPAPPGIVPDVPPPTRVGWFETETAEAWSVGESRTGDIRVWLTPAGRWVLTEQGIVEYLDADRARELLTAAGHGEVAVEHIDRPATGPGRPPIGPEVKLRLPAAVIAEVDRMAKANGVPRAEMLRQLVTDGVYAP